MKRSICAWAPVVILLVVAGVSRGTTTTIAQYRLGEDDPGAAPSRLGNDPTVDHGPQKLDLSRSGTPL